MVKTERFPSALIDSVKTPKYTDLSRWRLKVEHGAQTWHYLESDEELKQWPQTRWDKYFLGVPFVRTQFLSLFTAKHTPYLMALSIT
jgi:lanosterol synthase